MINGHKHSELHIDRIAAKIAAEHRVSLHDQRLRFMQHILRFCAYAALCAALPLLGLALFLGAIQ